MASLRKTITTSDAGTGPTTLFDNPFDDKPLITNFNTAKITRIVITFDSHLRSIAVHYKDVVGVARGLAVGLQQVILLQPGEYITTVQGSITDHVVSGISFETSIGMKWGPYGYVNTLTGFVWGGFQPEMGLLYFSGMESNYITILQATFASYKERVARPAELKFEKHVCERPDPAAVTLSHFATSLMSPPVTLVIGPDNTLFHTSQSILCRLPFFRAALQGGFLEASDQIITMPEDEPQTVAALIEFLYTGSYTYSYRASPEAAGEAAVELTTPATELLEGVYHAGVYSTAQKYGCAGLEEAALKAFMFVLGHLKGVDVMHLWEAAYAKDLTLSAVEERVEVEEFRTGLPRMMRELYTLHPTDMMQISVDYPELLHDLARLVFYNA